MPAIVSGQNKRPNKCACPSFTNETSYSLEVEPKLHVLLMKIGGMHRLIIRRNVFKSWVSAVRRDASKSCSISRSSTTGPGGGLRDYLNLSEISLTSPTTANDIARI